jgi:hypothetical protein
MQQARIFCGKALLLTREQERKSAAERGRERQRGREREAERERGRENIAQKILAIVTVRVDFYYHFVSSFSLLPF